MSTLRATGVVGLIALATGCGGVSLRTARNGEMESQRTLAGIPLEAGPLPVSVEDLEAAKAGGVFETYTLDETSLQLGVYVEAERRWETAYFQLGPTGSVQQASLFHGRRDGGTGKRGLTELSEDELLGVQLYKDPSYGTTELLVARTEQPDLYYLWKLRQGELCATRWLSDPALLESEGYTGYGAVIAELDRQLAAGEFDDVLWTCSAWNKVPGALEVHARKAKAEAGKRDAGVGAAKTAFTDWRARWDPAGFVERLALLDELYRLDAAHSKRFGEIGREQLEPLLHVKTLVKQSEAYIAQLPPEARVERWAAARIPELFGTPWLSNWARLQFLDAPLTPEDLQAQVAWLGAWAKETGPDTVRLWQALQPGVVGRKGWLAYQAWLDRLLSADGFDAQMAILPELEPLCAPYAADPGLLAICQADVRERFGIAARLMLDERVAPLRKAWQSADLDARFALLTQLKALQQTAERLGVSERFGDAEHNELLGQVRKLASGLPRSPLGLETTIERAVLEEVLAGRLKAWGLRGAAHEADLTLDVGDCVAQRASFVGYPMAQSAYEAHLAKVVVMFRVNGQPPLVSKLWQALGDTLVRGEVELAQVLEHEKVVLRLQDRGVNSLADLFVELLDVPHDTHTLEAIALPVWSAEDRAAVARRVSLEDLSTALESKQRMALRTRVSKALGEGKPDAEQLEAVAQELRSELRACSDPWLRVWHTVVQRALGNDTQGWLEQAAGVLAPFDAEGAQLIRAWVAFDRHGPQTEDDRRYAELAKVSGYRALNRWLNVTQHRAWRELAATHRLAKLELRQLNQEWDEDVCRAYLSFSQNTKRSPADTADRIEFLSARYPTNVGALWLKAQHAPNDEVKLSVLNRILALAPFHDHARLARAGHWLRADNPLGIVDAAVSRGLREKDIAWAMAEDMILELERRIARSQPVFQYYIDLAQRMQRSKVHLEAAYLYYLAEQSLLKDPSQLPGDPTEVLKMRQTLLQFAGSALLSGPDLTHDPETALVFLRRAAELVPDDDLVDLIKHEEVRALCELERPRDAQRVAQAMVARQRNEPVAWMSLAMAAGLTKDEAALDEARSNLIRLGVVNADHFYAAGVAYLVAGLRDKARDCLASALPLAPSTNWSPSDIDEVQWRLVKLNQAELESASPTYGESQPIQLHSRDGSLLVGTATVIGADDKRLAQGGYWTNRDLSAVATSSQEQGALQLHYRDQAWDCADLLMARALGVSGAGDTAAFVVRSIEGATHLVVGGKRSAKFSVWDKRAGFRFDPVGGHAAVLGKQWDPNATQGPGLSSNLKRIVVVNEQVSDLYDEVALPWYGRDGYAFWARTGKATFTVSAAGATRASGVHVRASDGAPGYVKDGLTVDWDNREATTSFEAIYRWGVYGQRNQHPFVLGKLGDLLLLQRAGKQTELLGWSTDNAVRDPLITFSEDGAHSLVLTSRDGRGQLFHDGKLVTGGGFTFKTGSDPVLSADGSWVAFTSTNPAPWYVRGQGMEQRGPKDVLLDEPREFTRLFEALPGGAQGQVQKLALSDDGAHTAWIASDAEYSRLFVDGELVHEANLARGEAIWGSSLGFTHGGQVFALARGKQVGLIYGHQFYPLPSEQRFLLKPVAVGAHGVRIALFHRRPDGPQRTRRVFFSLEVSPK